MELRVPYITTKANLSQIHSSKSFRALLQTLIEQDCKISNLIYRALICDRYTNPKKSFNYLSFREKKGMISYQTYGREQKYTENGSWSREGRQEIKPAKFAKDFLHPRLIAKFKDHEIAAFATRLKAFEESQTCSLEISDNLGDAYTSANYDYHIESCMFDKDVVPFYQKMGAKVVIAKKKTGRLAGRAIYWPSVEFHLPEGEVVNGPFMDRIYANTEMTELFIQWAETNKIWHKSRQNNSDYVDFINPEGECVDNVSAYVNCVPGESLKDLEFYPYMDTLLHGDNDNMITNNGDEDSSRFTYRQTNGSRLSNAEVSFVIDNTGRSIRESDAVSIDGIYYHNDSDLICYGYESCGEGSSTVQACWLLRSNTVMASNGDYYHKSLLENGYLGYTHRNDIYPKHELIELDGQVWYRYSPEIVYSQQHDRYFLRNDCITDVVTSCKIVKSAWSNSNSGKVERYTWDNFLKDDPNIAQCAVTGKWYLASLLTLDKDGRLVYVSPLTNLPKKDKDKSLTSAFFDQFDIDIEWSSNNILQEYANGVSGLCQHTTSNY
jgi:hypothetical protein